MRLFSTKDKKQKKPSTSDEEEAPSPTSRSPTKRSTPSRPKSTRTGDDHHRAEPGPPRRSRTVPISKHSSSSKKDKYDSDTHPLNLPPEQRKRFSALSAMSDPMDIDSEIQNGASSPSVKTTVPGAFDAPKTNGTNTNEEGPVPPPHKSNPTSPVAAPAPTPEEAEAFKANGNKFYKSKEYKKAIEEYTKGTASPHM